MGRHTPPRPPRPPKPPSNKGGYFTSGGKYFVIIFIVLVLIVGAWIFSAV